MKKLSLLTASLFALVLVGAGCASSPFAVGDSVLGNWKGGSRWWEAKVTAVQDGQVSVTYDSDKTTDTLAEMAVAHAPTKAASVKVGDMVVAKWSNNLFYGGKVTAVKDGMATVAWTDGSTPTDVALTNIAQPGK